MQHAVFLWHDFGEGRDDLRELRRITPDLVKFFGRFPDGDGPSDLRCIGSDLRPGLLGDGSVDVESAVGVTMSAYAAVGECGTDCGTCETHAGLLPKSQRN